jgi:membrane-associated phospholipid phosphatase
LHPAGGLDPRGSASGPAAARPLRIAGLCLAALALTWFVAALVPAGQARDAVALHDFTLLGRPSVDTVARGLLHLLDPPLFSAWAALLVAIALARGRRALAVAVAVVLALAPLSADLLKPLLSHSREGIGATFTDPASWPSGHAAAAAALALCAALVAPARLRPAVALLGGAFTAGVGCALLILAWHLPSDVVGGYLVAMLWGSLAVAALRALAARRRSGPAGRRQAGGSAPAVRAGVPQRF